MVLKNLGLRKLTTWIITTGAVVGLVAPTLELYNIIVRSNNVVIATEVLILALLLAEALIINNSKEWKHAILVALPVLLADIFARIFDLYRIIPGFGYFGHFWIGIALTSALILVYNKSFKFIFMSNLIIAFLWEVAEIIQDKIFAVITPNWLLDTYKDGFIDMTLQITGTIIGYHIIKKWYKI